MDRTNGAGHVGRMFVAEDIQTNRPPTEVTAQWLNGLQEELIAILLAAGVAPNIAVNNQVITALNSLFLNKGQAGLISQNMAGMTRTLTPVGGALMREWADAIAATTGNIEFGVSYNVAVNPVTGVWGGRDVADICWLEKWSDVGGVKEFWYAVTAAVGVVPAWTLAFSLNMVSGNLVLGKGAISQNFAGLIRTLTPIGGALVREWAGAVAVTTGNIEFGVSYNVAVNPVTGVWGGRDVADICWLEKWSEMGGMKQIWYANNAAAGVVPVWNLIFAINTVNGTVTLPAMPNNVPAGNSAATASYVRDNLPIFGKDAAGVRIPFPMAPDLDFNTLVEQGSYNFSCVNSPNRPVGVGMSWIFVDVYRHTNTNGGPATHITQVCRDMNMSSNPKTWERKCIGGVWYAWVEVGIGIGVGQLWTNVPLASRVSGVTYWNASATKSLAFTVSGSTTSSGQGISAVFINGVQVSAGNISSQTVAGQFNISSGVFIIPPGNSYSCTYAFGVNPIWSELS